MSITPQERELITIGIAVACGCKPCIRINMLAANQLQVTDQDIANAVTTAINVRRSATSQIEQFVLSGLTEAAEPEQSPGRHDDQRIETLVSVGAAFAVNCVSSLKKCVATAKAIGITDEDFHEVIRLSAFTKSMAASHVEYFMNPNEFQDETDTLAEYGTPFGPERCAWTNLCRSDLEEDDRVRMVASKV